MLINISPISAIIGLVLSIATLWGIVVKPFKEAIKENSVAMKALNDTVIRLQGDLTESQKDRANLHVMYEKLDDRVEKNTLDIARNEEKIATLFKRTN